MKQKFKEFKGELSKVIWPNRKELFKQTTTVIVVSIVVGAFISAVDGVFSVAMKLLTGII